MLTRRFVTGGMAAAVVAGRSSSAKAQSADGWPNKIVKIIVNFAPGGSTDNAMRPFADRLSRALEVATPYRRVSRNCHGLGKLIPRPQERSGGGVAGILLCHVGSPVDRPIREGPRCRVCPPKPF